MRRLQEIRKVAAAVTAEWDVKSTVYLEPYEREVPGDWRRERRIEEYPENRAANWETLAVYAKQLAVAAESLAAYAQAHRALT